MDHSSGQGGTPSVIERRFPALHFRGFGDVDFAGTDAKGTKSGFNMGQLILHMSSPLSEKVSVFGETSFTAQAGPTATAYNVDVERLLIRYDYNDFFKLSFGRYHTPINYWNTAFHHGLWLQTTIARPEMIRFGGRFLPVHFIGMQAEGNIPSGPIGLGYNAGLGNGRSGNIARGGDSGDVNNNRAWVVNLFARPAALNGLQVGGAVYGDLITVSPALTGNPQFRELITSASVLWTKETPEFLAEFAHVRHRNTITQQEFNNNAAYVQIAYRLPGEAHKWKPYYRFEWSNINPERPVVHYREPARADRDGPYRLDRRRPLRHQQLRGVQGLIPPHCAPSHGPCRQWCLPANQLHLLRDDHENTFKGARLSLDGLPYGPLADFLSSRRNSGRRRSRHRRQLQQPGEQFDSGGAPENLLWGPAVLEGQSPRGPAHALAGVARARRGPPRHLRDDRG
jgi:hypothetical protein